MGRSMKKQRLYYTGIFPAEDNLPDVSGQGWKAILVPCRKAWEYPWTENDKEIGILAHSRSTAQKALNYICDSLLVIFSDLALVDGGLEAVPSDPSELEEYEHQREMAIEPEPHRHSSRGFPLACHMAARVSRHRKYIYALALMRQSQKLHFNHPMDMHPKYYPYEHRSVQPIDHVRFAYAIVTAYAVLEQLGLDLRGGAFHKGKWIQRMRGELENRLGMAGVDPDETIMWLIRGGKARLESRRTLTIAKKCSWARGRVRDSEVLFVDAIAEVRWLRSGVSAHKIDDMAAVLSTHDVANAQHLARVLFLKRLGYYEEIVERTRAATR
jgi:hypothetical protein